MVTPVLGVELYSIYIEEKRKKPTHYVEYVVPGTGLVLKTARMCVSKIERNGLYFGLKGGNRGTL